MMWVCSGKFARDLFNRPGAPFRFKDRLLQVEVMEAQLVRLYDMGPARRPQPAAADDTPVIGYLRAQGSYRQLSYCQALKRVGARALKALFGSGTRCSPGASPDNRSGGSRDC